MIDISPSIYPTGFYWPIPGRSPRSPNLNKGVHPRAHGEHRPPARPVGPRWGCRGEQGSNEEVIVGVGKSYVKFR